MFLRNTLSYSTNITSHVNIKIHFFTLRNSALCVLLIFHTINKKLSHYVSIIISILMMYYYSHYDYYFMIIIIVY